MPTLAPGDCQGYYVSFTLPTSVALGTPVFNLVTVTSLINPDINLANNRDTLHQIVTGSWDPNNKLANGTFTHPETSTKYILPNTELEYTVNFQNTGTAPAAHRRFRREAYQKAAPSPSIPHPTALAVWLHVQGDHFRSSAPPASETSTHPARARRGRQRVRG